ncbi:hypothetical protein JZ751_013884 [Albula glossodonta]|uniref:Uncharacterized protein n=1 Tax=Albula glossodonta TaxID=121402 RepID=A0A8T2N5B8_9TELE|nr:hypothetical protein JZ751_013884 [Albula glossodonta]
MYNFLYPSGYSLSMDTAKRLQVELGSWLRVREEVVRKLKALAKQAEDLYQSGTGGQSFFRVLLWLDNGATTRSMVEKLMSSKTMEDLKRIIIKDIAKEGEIKILWRRLEIECAGILLHAKGAEKAFGVGRVVQDWVSSCHQLANKKPSEVSKALKEKAEAMKHGAKKIREMLDLIE